MPLEMPPEAIAVLIIGIFFFIFAFIRAVWLAVRTKEKGFWYSSIVGLMFVFTIMSILLGNPIVCVALMILIVPYTLFILLKYWKRLISAQKELFLKGYSLQEPMKASDYLSLFFYLKGWLKLAEKQGKNRTICIYILFNALTLSILEAWASYRFPNFYPFPLSLVFIVPALILSAYFFSTYLEIDQSDKKEKL